MLSTSNPTRRTNQKPELSSLSSDFPLIAPADNYTWHLNGTGSGVDPAAEWDITEGMVKMRINGDDIHGKLCTPPKSKSTGPGHESSPLETSSDASLDSSSPSDQHLGLPSHSRGSSTDTTLSSHGSSTSRTLQGAQYGVDRDGEQWGPRDQPTYPSLSVRDQDFQVDYNSQRQFNNAAQGAATFVRASSGVTTAQYRQPQATRNFNPQIQNIVPNPPSFPYASPHVSVGNTQQLYDMMIPNAQDPAIARAQQQQPFRTNHQHSSSDPANLRDAAALQQLLVNNLQFGGPGMYPPAALGQPALTMFANQFYGSETYPAADLAAAQLMAARIQSQYQGSYGVSGAQNLPGSAGGMNSAVAAAAAALAGTNGNGPSANNRKLGLYKTELCRSWEEKGTCRYGNKCQFAHGEDELRKVPRHPKYKTEICRTFWVSGSCPYGKRCCFIHTELPSNGIPGSENTPPPAQSVGRDRSSSTNSDPNDTTGSSLLARISAKRNQEASSNGTGSTSSTPPSTAFVNTRPPTGSLRVDTSVLDPAASGAKQNKSAYPTLANGMLIQANAPAPIMTHGPVTAGPDFGRHASARLDIVGHNHQRMGKHQSRPSYNGSDNGMEPLNQSPITATGDASMNIPRTSSRGSSGHMRSGSAGNWNVSRSSNLASHTSYPLTSGPDVKPSAPWLTEVSVGPSRLSSEQTWV